MMGRVVSAPGGAVVLSSDREGWNDCAGNGLYPCTAEMSGVERREGMAAVIVELGEGKRD